MVATRWFYAKANKRHGPMDLEPLVKMLLTGELPLTTLVWNSAMTDWIEAEHVPEIAHELPPPLPPTAIGIPPAPPPRVRTPQPSAAEPAPAATPRTLDLLRRLEKDPDSRLFAALAEELRKDGNLEETIRICREGLQKHPKYPSARITLGRALLASGDLDAASAEFEHVLREAPDNIRAQNLLEESLEKMGETRGWRAWLDRPRPASAAAPESPSQAAPPPPAPSESEAQSPAATAGEATAVPTAPPDEIHEEFPDVPPPEPEPPAIIGMPVASSEPPAPAPVEPVASPRPIPSEPPAIIEDRVASPSSVDLPPPLPADRPSAAASTSAKRPPRETPAPKASPALVTWPTWSLADKDFPDVVQDLHQQRWTGICVVNHMAVEKLVMVQGGRLVFASSSNKDDRLGELLLRKGRITLGQYIDASRAVRKGKRLGTILVEQGALDPTDLVKVVVEHTQEIICSLFELTEGVYQLRDGIDSPEAITLKLSTPDLILEGIRRIRSWSRIERGIGGVEARYERSPTYLLDTQSTKLPPERLSLIMDLSEPRDVKSICESSPMAHFEVCRTLWAFRVVGLIRRIDV